MDASPRQIFQWPVDFFFVTCQHGSGKVPLLGANGSMRPAPRQTGQPSQKRSETGSPPSAAARDAADEIEEPVMLTEDALGNIPLAPEIVDPKLAELTKWDESPDSSGHRVPPITPEDEAQDTELLVEEGLDEAEDELRDLDGEEDVEDEG
jgi:hypothetical protein